MNWRDGRMALGKLVRRAPLKPSSETARLRRINAHLTAAIELADQGQDPLLGVKLHACIAHIDEALAVPA